MEATHFHGKDAIRDYWTHQRSVIDPHVEPLKITKAAEGSLVVDVHQVVKNLEVKTLIDGNRSLPSASKVVVRGGSTSRATLNCPAAAQQRDRIWGS
jgi:hypothetical protein